ncbi:hypothetical protein ACHHYP_06744 [Achlya hypogyna]|uniref:Calcineurin-like phosphoesterase domain-containing protein n=1 Tax=Achlya hypogyna TaxID=1202772 RepID=A0A1V9YSG7_ACHHY|nr:hypothetical protein ACHHYP_06744 [Achlya hypogyna]
MVFGNHDEGATASRTEMMQHISSLPYGLTQPGPDGIGGVGNYIVEAWDIATKQRLLRLYFLDTGVSGAVSAGQKEFLLNASLEHEDPAVPALAFFHIPTPDYIVAAGDHIEQGHQGEGVSHGPECGLLETLVKMGDVKATFVGHDHFNDYCIQRQGIHMCYGGGIGYGAAYGSVSILRRARVIEWTQNDTAVAIKTWIHAAGGATSKDKLVLYERTV